MTDNSTTLPPATPESTFKLKAIAMGLLGLSVDRAKLNDKADPRSGEGTIDIFEIDHERFGTTIRITVETTPITKNLDDFCDALQRFSERLMEKAEMPKEKLVHPEGWQSDGGIA